MADTKTQKANITAFCCHNALYRGKNLQGAQKAGVPGVHTVEVPCSGKVEPIQLLKAFENGAECVVVVVCPPRQCMTIEGSRRQARRIARTKDLLAEAGVEPERLILHMAESAAAQVLPNIMAAAQKTIAGLGTAAPARSGK